jgi:hypothetical protein
VVRSAEGVDTSPGYWMRLSPTVRQTRRVSTFLGRMFTIKCPLVTILPFGIAWHGIQKIVLDPSILPPTPWARRPNLCAAALFHTVTVVSSCMSWR